MALKSESQHSTELNKEIQGKTKQMDGQTKQKRRLVAKKEFVTAMEIWGLGKC
jgi:uncharacterized protein YoxC